MSQAENENTERRDELTEAQRAIASMIAKLEKVLVTLKPEAKPQRTLAERRLKALRIASELIARELEVGDRG